eukprot:scaffold24326_cov79-Skeletonema_dohrnii-CCMP3373.AAC.5
MVEDGGDDDVFVYMGGDQVVPRNVRRVKIDISVKFIPPRAFTGRHNLIYVEFHDGVERIEEFAFPGCTSLRSVKSLGVKFNSENLRDVEFNSLETIGNYTFKYITMPSLKIIGLSAFDRCGQLIDLDLPEGLEMIGIKAFQSCHHLRRIGIPLKCMIGVDIFAFCPKLVTVDLVGGMIHRTVASLHLENWRNEMKDEIYRINQDLPNIRALDKTAKIQQWMESVIRRINYYKDGHIAILKEATTLLELALWKANLDEKGEDSFGERETKRAQVDTVSEKNESRITSGANIVIKNVLPFLTSEPAALLTAHIVFFICAPPCVKRCEHPPHWRSELSSVAVVSGDGVLAFNSRRLFCALSRCQAFASSSSSYRSIVLLIFFGFKSLERMPAMLNTLRLPMLRTTLGALRPL